MVPGSEENSWEVHIISTGWGVSWHGITPIGNSSEQVGSVSRGESGQCPAPSTERISNDVPQPIPESSWLIRSPPSLSLVSSPIFSSGSPWSLRWTWWSTVSPLCPLFTCSLPRWNLGLGSESFIFWDSIRSSHIISSGEPGAPDTSGKPEAPDTSEGLEEEGKEGASNDIGGGNLNLRFRDGEKSGLSVSPFTSKTFYEFWFFQCCLVEPVILCAQMFIWLFKSYRVTHNGWDCKDDPKLWRFEAWWFCMVCLSICMVYFMIKHRNKTVLTCKETWMQENGINKFCKSSLKSHSLWVTLYLKSESRRFIHSVTVTTDFLY